MQNFSCSTLQEGQITTLIDSRDGNPYNVAKLKDNKCWMVDNLRLGKKGAPMTLKSTDSDVTADFELPASAAANFLGTDNNVAYVSSEYGGYYSWYTATAGTGKAAMTSGNATSSICPKGWKLPTGRSGGDLEVMAKKYGSNSNYTDWLASLRATPIPGFILAGFFVGSSINNQNEYGFYWSSTASDGAKAYHLHLIASPANVNPGLVTDKGRGESVRCIAK